MQQALTSGVEDSQGLVNIGQPTDEEFTTVVTPSSYFKHDCSIYLPIRHSKSSN